MLARTRCHRHSAKTWIANCTECTAWHLPIQLARRYKGPYSDLKPMHPSVVLPSTKRGNGAEATLPSTL